LIVKVFFKGTTIATKTTIYAAASSSLPIIKAGIQDRILTGDM